MSRASVRVMRNSLDRSLSGPAPSTPRRGTLTSGPSLGPMTGAPASQRAGTPTPSGPASRRALDEFLDRAGGPARPRSAPTPPCCSTRRAPSVSGGKRFRAAFCYWGYRAIVGTPERRPTSTPCSARCAALEVLHASALVHDDYMDASDTRRGRPATHRAFEADAPTRRLARRPRAVRRRGGDPARRPAALLGRRAAAPLRARLGPGRAGARAVRPVPLGGDHRPVPRRLGAGARPGRRGRRDAGAALQVGEVLHRAAVAHRRGARRGPTRRRSRRSARSGCRWARRSSCATTCWGSSATPTSPASRRATTWSRASARCWSRWPWTRSAPRTRRCSTAPSAPARRAGRRPAASGHRRLRRARPGGGGHRGARDPGPRGSGRGAGRPRGARRAALARDRGHPARGLSRRSRLVNRGWLSRGWGRPPGRDRRPSAGPRTSRPARRSRGCPAR